MIGKHWGKLAIGAGIALVVGLSAATGYFVAKLDGPSTPAALEVAGLPTIETSPEAAQDVTAGGSGAIDAASVSDTGPLEAPDGSGVDDKVAARAESQGRDDVVEEAAVAVAASKPVSKPTPIVTAVAAAEVAAPASRPVRPGR